MVTWYVTVAGELVRFVSVWAIDEPETLEAPEMLPGGAIVYVAATVETGTLFSVIPVVAPLTMV